MKQYHYKTVLLLALLSFVFACDAKGQEKGSDEVKALVSSDKDYFRADTCTLLFAGDVMSHSPQLKSAYRSATKDYDYKPCFTWIKSQVQKADLAVANLETTLAGKPYRGYPQFSAPDALAIALKDAGFDALSTSNNHSADRGKQGILRTLDVLDNLDIEHFGSYRDEQERAKACPLILDVKGIRVALMAYTYGTNGMPVPKPTIVDTIQRQQMARDLWRADSLGADYKIVFVHWGQEYKSKPSKAQKDLAQWLHQHNVNAIIGSHPHVIQGSELLRDSLYTDTFVEYSLGNFISNQRTPAATRGGLMVGLHLVSRMECEPTEKAPHRVVRLERVNYDFVFVNKKTPKGKMIYQLLPLSLDYEGVPKVLPKQEQKDYRNFVSYCKRLKFVSIGLEE